MRPEVTGKIVYIAFNKSLGSLLRSCMELRKSIELSFGVVSGVGPGTDVRNGGPRGSRESGGF